MVLSESQRPSGKGNTVRVLVAGRLSRKATDRDQTGFDSQERESVEWAKRNGHEVVAVVADFKSGRSGLDARTNLRPWVTEPARLAQYDAIVALKVDRLTRGNREETAKLEDWAREHGKQLVITGADVHFPSEGTDGIQWDLMLRMAHQEWLNTSERYTRMHRTLREAGSLNGRAPYGFTITRTVNTDGRPVKTLMPDPVEASVITDMATWYLAGESLEAICGRLNASGRLPRRMHDGRQPVWQAKSVTRLLRNETLAGRRKDGQGLTLLKVQPVLTRDVWERVVRRLDTRATRKGISQSKAPAMLTSVIRCGRCDRNMYRTGTGYYCRVVGCNTFVDIKAADDFIRALMENETYRDVIENVVPGSSHDEEIAEVKRDMAEAVAAEDFGKLAALQAELKRLRSLPATPTHVERKLSDKTIAEMWASFETDTERRTYLVERGAKLTIAYREDGKARKFVFHAPWREIQQQG